ncbi:MAG: hypothetical protein ABL925_19290 [Methylococcales bacterium]
MSYSIDLTDLWPVFGGSGLAGLADIRNKLIHGDPFGHEMFQSLIVANEHLKYTLERVLSRVLQWDIAETKVNPVFLQTYTSIIIDMPSEQAILSEYVNSPSSARA